MVNISQAKISKGYNKIVVAFFILAIVIILFTAYFAFAKTTIIITPAPQIKESKLEISVNDLKGEILTTKISDSYTYNDLTDENKITEEGYATGTVTIYNNYSIDQPLVATTRLLSEEGVLFRTQQDVVVPAGGSVEVEVKADESGENGDIGPSKFEIVALNSTKKKFIYAESTEPMSGGLITKTVITETDINNAKEAAKQSLIKKLKTEFSQKTKSVSEKNIALEFSRQETNVNVGDTASSITVNMEATAYYALFPEENLIQACLNQIQQAAGSGYDVYLSSDQKDIDYLTEFQNNQQIIKANCQGKVVINANSALINKDQLTNKTANQIKKYLQALDEVKNVQVNFSPFWVKTTPFIKENIIIEVQTY